MFYLLLDMRLENHFIVKHHSGIDEEMSMYREIPEEYISEDMIIYMAKTNPGQLGFRFPERFRTEAFVREITNKYPETKRWLHRAGIGTGWFEYDE